MAKAEGWEAAVEVAETENQRLRAELEGCHGLIAAIIATAGGMVEGYPTDKHNILQRLRALRAIEDAQIVPRTKGV